MSSIRNSNQQPPEFHPQFNRDVFAVVFMVDGTGFKLDAACLTSHSEFLDNMLFKSAGLGLSGEGRSIDNPIEVLGCTKEAFADFCGWLNHFSWSPLRADHASQVINILHISHMWGMQAGIEYATIELLCFDLRPAHRIRLAFQYSLRQWVTNAVRELLATPLNHYTPGDIDHLGLDLFVIISKAKETIATARKRFGNFVPYPPARNLDAAAYCSHHDNCRKIWYERWFTAIVRRIHDVNDPIPLLQLPDELQALDHRGMDSACKEYILVWFRDLQHVQVEENLIQTTVDAIFELCPAPAT